MDEARAVLERLERIEKAADRDELLAELRELVREVEAWTAVEVRRVRAARPVETPPHAPSWSLLGGSSHGRRESRLR